MPRGGSGDGSGRNAWRDSKSAKAETGPKGVRFTGRQRGFDRRSKCFENRDLRVAKRLSPESDVGRRRRAMGGCNSLLHSCLGPHRPERSISNSHCNRRMPAGRSSRLPTGRLGQVPHINRCTNRDRWEPRARARSFPRLARPLASPRRVLEGGSADPRPQSARPATGSRTTRLRAHESHSA